jgi:hypothetical protein
MKALRQLFSHLKHIWDMPNKHEKQYQDMYNYVAGLHRKISENTTVHADIHYKGEGTQIIVVGRYRNKDYVRAFTVRQESLSSLIEMLKIEEKYAKVGRFDMVGGMDFSAVYDRDEF